MTIRLAVDVGGTHTDAVILDFTRGRGSLLGSVKVPTSPDVETGIVQSMESVLEASTISSEQINYVMIGTTQSRNAILQRQGLARIGLIRIGSPSVSEIEPFFTWSEDLREAIGNNWFLVDGGYEFDGRPISQINEEQVRKVLLEIKRQRLEAIAVCGVFSPVCAQQELEVGRLAEEVLGPGFPITLSHQVGSIGLLERENSAALNAALAMVAKNIAEGLEKALRLRNIKAPTYFSQNDGTLMSIEYAKKYSILTICSGPSNSIRGAAFLSGLKDCIVIDVGGTSTDIGILQNGYPRESYMSVALGEVETNFRMPDLISLGLGGGSIVKLGHGKIEIGPESVGYNIISRGKTWGGDILTLTDAAIAANILDMNKIHPGGRSVPVQEGMIKQVFEKVNSIIEGAIDKIKTSHDPLPVILVGGGSLMVNSTLRGASEVIRPKNYEFANAIGAAIAKVGGEVDKIWSLRSKTREQVMREAKSQAIAEAVRAGADSRTVEILDVEEFPVAYLPVDAVRLKIKAAGELPSEGSPELASRQYV